MKSLYRKILITLWFFLSVIHHGKALSPGFYVEAGGHYGFVMAHRTRIEHLSSAHNFGVECSIEKQTNGSRIWQQEFNYPKNGFTFLYINFRNQLLGKAVAGMYFIKFPLIKFTNLQFDLKMAAGLGYLTERYQRVENHKNLAIGSAFNVSIQTMLGFDYNITSDLILSSHLGITHFSNGAYRVPNLGINNVSITATLACLVNADDGFTREDLPDIKRRMEYEAIVAAGVKEALPANGEKYLATTFALSACKPVFRNSFVIVGTDVFKDHSLEKYIYYTYNRNVRKVELWRVGAHTGYELSIGKMYLVFNMGYYILDKTNADTDFYHRLGLKYSITKNLKANISLKTHYARADFFELGLAYRIGGNH